MADEKRSIAYESSKYGVEAWNALLEKTLQLSGAVVDRNSFLAENLYGRKLKKAIAKGPPEAWVPVYKMDEIANSVISSQSTTVGKKAAAKAAVGLVPFGLGSLALKGGKMLTDKLGWTEKASEEMRELYSLLVVAQSLAYTYGVPDLNQNNNLASNLTMLIQHMDEEIVKQEKSTAGDIAKSAGIRVAQGLAEKAAKEALTDFVPGVGIAIKAVKGAFSVHSTVKNLGAKLNKLKDVLRESAIVVVNKLYFRRWRTTLLLSIFLGWLGIHRFFTGKIISGLLFPVGWAVSMFMDEVLNSTLVKTAASFIYNWINQYPKLIEFWNGFILTHNISKVLSGIIIALLCLRWLIDIIKIGTGKYKNKQGDYIKKSYTN
jgi:hypothetical protein